MSNTLSSEELLRRILEGNQVNASVSTQGQQQQQQGGKAKKEPIEMLLYKIVTENCHLYYDRNKNIYVEVSSQAQQNETQPFICKINSQDFRDWLAYKCFIIHSKTPSKPHIVNTSRILRHEALVKGKEVELFDRVASVKGEIYIDLGTTDRKMVKVDAFNWYEGNYPIFFKRLPLMEELPYPVKDGQLKEILEFFPPLEEHQQCLVQCWLVASFIEHIERPFLLLEGPSGSGKTTLGLILKEFLDPMEDAALSYNDNENEVAQIIDHQYVPLLDNVTQISRKLSDLMCKAFSGGSHLKKELYTDDKDFILKLSGNIIFTSIKLRKPKADFLSRCYKVEINKTELSNRSRELLTQKFKEAKPRIFGALLDTISATLAKVKDIKTNGKYRTVDFDRYASAAAEVMGYGVDFFQEARDYCEEIKIGSITNATPIIEALKGYLLSNNGHYSGNLKKLLQQFPKFTGSPDELPKEPHVLSRRLREIQSEIDAAGIVFEKKKGNDHNGTRWEFKLINQQVPSCPQQNPVAPMANENVPDHGKVSGEFSNGHDEASDKDEPPLFDNPFLFDDVTIDSMDISSTDVNDFSSMSEGEQDKILRDIGLK